MSEQRPWKMSIVDAGVADPRTLLEHPLNPKIHTVEQDRVVEASLNELGWLRRLLWNRRTGHVLDGHERLKLALELREPLVPIDIVDLPEEDEGKVLLLLDQSAALAQPHPERWAQLRQAVTTETPALVGFWTQYAAAQGWATGAEPGSAGLGEPGAIDEAEVDVTEARLAAVRAKWPVQPGEVWAAGRHRLVCGDCLEGEAVTQLLAGAVPTLVVADPPYGVNIVQTNGFVGGGEAYAIPFGGVKRDARQRVSGGQRTKDRTGHYPIEQWGQVAPRSESYRDPARYPLRNDHRGGTPVGVGKYAPVIGDESTATAIRAATHFLTTYPQAVHVWWGGNYYADHLPASTCWLVWDKETTGHFADCELAWTNQAKAAKLFHHRWNGMLRDSERERRWHPTQKPAALMAWVYDTLGQPSDVVLDPFVGSGPTLIAAEQRGPTLYGCERSPDYVSIALERWALLTGETPRQVA